MATLEQPKPRKKSTIKLAHQEAIKLFCNWLKKNPNATHKERHERFDFYVDAAVFDKTVKRAPDS